MLMDCLTRRAARPTLQGMKRHQRCAEHVEGRGGGGAVVVASAGQLITMIAAARIAFMLRGYPRGLIGGCDG